MTNSRSLIKLEMFEITHFQEEVDIHQLQKTHIAYSGSPVKHPHDKHKLLLVIDPYSANSSYYEFKKSDIGHIEELQSSVNLKGDTCVMIRLWIRKGCIGIKCTPFIAEQTPSLDF
ncbi:MAG: inorganic pyrophosphatase Ppa [Proteobacteria bacterium]|nr:MAG: inorganic pyrophosphatase Ppa [Pseudomonadota bacterium]PIE40105.1 MAG: inorganic pyrophosphatase Ppa [Gammaproteobacteria bacterium]